VASGRSWVALALSALATLGGGCSLLLATDDLGGQSEARDGGAGPGRGDASPRDGDAVLEAAPPADAPPPTDLPSPLLYYYAFGDPFDSSGRGLHGKVLANSRVDVPGVRGSGLSCSGVPHDGFELGGDFLPGTTSFTMTLFYKLATASSDGPNQGYNTLFAKGCQFQNSLCDHRGFGMGISASAQKLVAYVQDQGGVKERWTAVSFQSPSVVDASFHHVAFVVDRAAGAIALFVDGVERSRESLRADYGSLDNSEWPGTLCTQVDDLLTMNGIIDEVMIFGRSLTAAEVSVLAARR
jgi:hypothetical protein